jgi:hypothetical protein
MDNYRISFSKDKVGTYQKGDSGITATTASASKTYGIPDLNPDGTFTSTNLLNSNIDKLAKTLGYDLTEIKEEDLEEDMNQDYSELTEQEMINNLDDHLSNFGQKKATKSKNDNFCRNCGLKYITNDNFCANCGFKRI